MRPSRHDTGPLLIIKRRMESLRPDFRFTPDLACLAVTANVGAAIFVTTFHAMPQTSVSWEGSMAGMPKSMQRWIVRGLVVGLVLLGIVAQKSASDRDAALAMPISDNLGDQGSFTELRGDWFSVPHTAKYEYEPSQAIRELSTKHMDLHGVQPRVWYEFAPATKGEMPLVILFHGAGRDGLSQIEMWKDVAVGQGFALLAPDSVGSSWFNDPSPQFIVQLIAEMASKHKIDTNRIYLFGHSDGAAYALSLLNQSQGPWRAAALHAGYVPLKSLNPPQVAKPYRLYMGEHEQIFSVDEARQIGKSLAGYGHDNELVVIPRHDHWFYDIGPQIAEDAWKWFQSQS